MAKGQDEDQTLLDKLTQQLMEEDAQFALDAAITILRTLSQYHQEGCDQDVMDEEYESVAAWAYDKSRIDSAVCLIHDIKL